MNLTLVTRFWSEHSDKPPAWVDGDDDLLNALVADELGCRHRAPEVLEGGLTHGSIELNGKDTVAKTDRR
jgi:hypothetical protein